MPRPTDEDATLQLAASVRELQDALRVLQSGFSEVVIRHGEILREHDRLIRDQDRMMREFAVRTTSTFERIHATLNTMLEHSGEVSGRLDDHEARLAALEGKKG